jgi:hypothetical protein
MPNDRRQLSGTLVLVLALLLGATPTAAAQESLEGQRARYALEAKVSASKGGRMLGSWPVEGEFSVGFGEKDEQGLQQIEFSLDRLEAPGVPGLGTMLDAFVGQKATLVFDEHGRLVDLELPLPEDALAELRSRLVDLPSTPPREMAPRTIVQGLRELRPGTLITFGLTMPRDGQPDQDRLSVEVEFAGPDEGRNVYVILARSAFDFDAGVLAAQSGRAAGGQEERTPQKPTSPGKVAGRLHGRTEFSLEHGQLSLFDLELAMTVLGESKEPPVELGAKLTVTLAEVLPQHRHDP